MPDLMKINNSTIRLMKGDITELEVGAFVFYAQHDLQLGTGFGTAIAQRGGASIQEEASAAAPVETTAVVTTGAGKLKADHLLHAVGPRFQEPDIEGKLRTTVLNCLKAADAAGATTLALPAMGAGYYGIPLADCASISLQAIRDYLCQETGLTEVVVCLLDSRELKPFSDNLSVLAAATTKA